MRILAVGDVVGRAGREYLYRNLGKIRSKYNIDFAVVNGENAAETNGITSEIAERLISAGADVITMGNHTFSSKGSSRALEDIPSIIRPLNFPPEFEGEGFVRTDLGYASVTVIDLIGRINMIPSDNPFRAIDVFLNEHTELSDDIIVVDMHAEATSERLAMGNFLDGRASAVFGTHTHVQTADERILPLGTGYISDLGMTGIMDSIIGTKKSIILEYFYSPGRRYRFEKETSGEVWLNGCIFDIDTASKKATDVTRLRLSEV